MDTRLRKETKNGFEKYFFKLISNSIFGKTMENVRKLDIKLVTTDKKRNKLLSEPNYHTTRRFSENVFAIEMKKSKVKLNKAVYLGMPIQILAKRLCRNFWMTILNQRMETEQKYVTWILIALLFIF